MNPKLSLWATIAGIAVTTVVVADTPASSSVLSANLTIKERMERVRETITHKQNQLIDGSSEASAIDNSSEVSRGKFLISWENSPGWGNGPIWTNWNNGGSYPSWSNGWANWNG
jgi:rSAM-associated Gly-rich repeat protein